MAEEPPPTPMGFWAWAAVWAVTTVAAFGGGVALSDATQERGFRDRLREERRNKFIKEGRGHV